MARRKVITTPMMPVERKYPTTPFLAWGTRQVRKVTTKAESPRLLAYRACMARELGGGKTYADLKEVQTAFKTAAPKCAREVAGKTTVWETGRAPKGYTAKY